MEEEKIYKIMLPPDCNCKIIKTKNLLGTLEQIFIKENIYRVAILPPGGFFYFYLSKPNFEKLKKGERVTVVFTTIPWNGFPMNILEAWGKGYFKLP
ncbi:MAG: hypothetical protein NC827_05870 [Candidatus Omnitrophica bacterium]|nr:hypothetical protein [Candidatus Omnitrophota bacterium]